MNRKKVVVETSTDSVTPPKAKVEQKMDVEYFDVIYTKHLH